MPKVFIFENVKGLLSSNGGNDYKEVIKTFHDMGYLIASKVVNTKEHGIPQNRERVFIVGFLDADQYHSFNFLDAEPLELRLRDILEDDVDEKYYLSEKMISGFIAHKERHKERGNGFAFNPRLAEDIENVSCLSCGYGNRPTDTFIEVKSATACGYETATENDSINFTYPDSKTRRGRVGKGVAQTLDCACNQGVIEPKIQVIGSTGGGNEMNSRIYSTDGLAPTLNAGSGGGGQSPVKHLTSDYRIRKLTPKECFRLQGVKDEDIGLSVSDSQAYKIAGNAISVNVMQMILRQIYKPKPSGGLF